MDWLDRQMERRPELGTEDYRDFLLNLFLRVVFIALPLMTTISIGVAAYHRDSHKSLQSECIRLGYGERDNDGNFVLKDGKNYTSE